MFQVNLGNSEECYQTLMRQAREWRRIASVFHDLGERWNNLQADNHLFPNVFTVAYSPETKIIEGSALTRAFRVTLSPASQGASLRGLCAITTPNHLKGGDDLLGKFFLDESGIIYEESGTQATQESIYNNGGWLLLANVFNVVATLSEQTNISPNA